MRATSRVLVLSAAALLAGCAYLPHPFASREAPPAPQPQPMAAAPAPVLTGALVAPERNVGPGYSGSSMPPMLAPGSAVRLSANDTTALLANNTAIGLTDTGLPYLIYFSADGAARFRQANTADSGTWHVLQDGELCSHLPRIASGETCYILSRYGDVILFQSQDGLAVGSVRVVSGNPQAL